MSQDESSQGSAKRQDSLKDGKKNHQGEGGGAPMKWTPVVLDSLADKLLEWMKVKENFWLGEFAVENEMSRPQLDELSHTERSVKFANALKIAKTMQETKLMKLGMSKKYNPAMAIFALKNVAGWRDRTDITTGDEPITGVEVTIKRSKK